MELKRAEIIEALECWASGNACEGSRCKLFDITPDTCDRWIGRTALALIKKLEDDIAVFASELSRYQELCKKLADENERVRADTVRKMHHKIWLEFSDCLEEEKVCVGSFRDSVDQIAKEMLEEVKEDGTN